MDTAILRKAILVRKFEQKLLDLFSEGRLNGTVHTCVGQELTPTVINDYLIPSDMIFSNHRGHGHFIVHFGQEMKSMLLWRPLIPRCFYFWHSKIISLTLMYGKSIREQQLNFHWRLYK